MSPEQMRSSRGVDARTDIWALGAVLYRLLTGATPFRADTVLQLYRVVARAAPRPPSELRPDIPPDLEAVILRCLEKDRARRFTNAYWLAEALLPFAGEGARAPIPRAPSSGRLEPASRLPLVDEGPKADRHAETAPDDREVVAPNDPEPRPPRAPYRRMESESPASTVTPKPATERRGTVHAVVIAAGAALVAVAAAMGIAVLQPPRPRAAGAGYANAPAGGPSARAAPLGAPGGEPPPGSIQSAAAAPPPVTPEPMVDPAPAVAVSAVPPKLWGRLPPRDPLQK